MGKRGPPPKGEYADKSAVLSTRISAELRVHLENAAKASGSTLSREIEHRLRRTFQEEKTTAEMFGGLQNYRLMQLVGVAMGLREQERESADWLNDPSLFLQVLRSVQSMIFERTSPPTTSGRSASPAAIIP